MAEPLLISKSNVGNPGMQHRSDGGFTLIDIMVTIALFSIVMGMALPALSNVAERLKLGQAVREVERELQTARLKAVTSNRPVRVRFNCPSAGRYRMVELIGSPSAPVAADTNVTRCGEDLYPFPANDRNPLTRPNHDGPVRTLPTSVSFGAAPDLEFWPDGSVHQQAAAVPWPTATGEQGSAVNLTKDGKLGRIRVNGVGKIQIELVQQ